MNLTMEEFCRKIADSIVNLEEEVGVEMANQALLTKFDLLDVIELGYAEGIRKVVQLYDEGEYYLPEIMLAAKIFQDSLAILTPKLKENTHRNTLVTVVMATIEGDLHSIGKTIVGIMLGANGFDVYDLGADVKIDTIIAEAEKHNADIIGVSALLTTTMQGQKSVVDQLVERNLRAKFKVMIGGAPVTQKWTEESGADGYAGSAIEAVALAKKLMGN
ncbi:MAG: dimethylamine corrinoid protein 3 [Promethearchaeota archaeon]|nr:MAG: dimethylamine corrinoid protein 3 [Candidatus Lokiarchaeota archaeon]